MKIGTRGRIPDFNIRELSTSAGSPVQSKSDTCAKLLKLREHCMKNPDTPVNLEKIYRLMYDPSLYELAYNKLKSNPGNMTAGITPTTPLDGMSMEVIERIIEKLKDNSFKFTPGRRVEIPKASGGTRPLTIAPPN
jgi:retron-type reverse transcriptase